MYMYVRVCACVCVCMYVCMYVCICVYVVYASYEACTVEIINYYYYFVCMYVVCIYVCMYVGR